VHGAPTARYFLPQGAQQQTCQPPLLLSIDGTDRRTTDTIDPAAAASVTAVAADMLHNGCRLMPL